MLTRLAGFLLPPVVAVSVLWVLASHLSDSFLSQMGR